MNTDDETSPSGELPDRQLDLFLAAANKEILQRIEAAADPTHTLTAIMAQNTGTNAVIQGPTGASGPEAGQLRAALMIGIRSTTHRLVLDLADARDLGRARNSALDCDFPLGSNSAPDPILDSDLAFAHALARALDRSIARAYALDNALGLGLGLVSVQVLAVTVARDLGRARALDRALALDHAFARVRDRTRGRALGRALDRILGFDVLASSTSPSDALTPSTSPSPSIAAATAPSIAPSPIPTTATSTAPSTSPWPSPRSSRAASTYTR